MSKASPRSYWIRDEWFEVDALARFQRLEELLRDVMARLDAMGAPPAVWLRTEEAAAALGIKGQSLDHHVKEDSLHPIKRHGRNYYSEAEVTALQERLRRRTQSSG